MPSGCSREQQREAGNGKTRKKANDEERFFELRTEFTDKDERPVEHTEISTETETVVTLRAYQMTVNMLIADSLRSNLCHQARIQV